VLFAGVHETRWRFSRPVFLEPHLVRLTPRTDAAQRLESFTLDVSPEPAGRAEIEDACGNRAWKLWFEGLHDELVLTTAFTARTLRQNPFDYLLDPGAHRLPPALPGPERAGLAACLAPLEGAAAARSLGRDIAREAGGDAVAFLAALTAWLYGNVAVVAREEPGFLAPDRTLKTRRGACRDTALVFLAACRAVGVPARFVSCYQQGDAHQAGRDLHACAEAYLPGAGWRGYDPTLGLVAADAHLMLCAGHDPALTAPVTGTFRGTGVASEMSHRIDLSVTD